MKKGTSQPLLIFVLYTENNRCNVNNISRSKNELCKVHKSKYIVEKSVYCSSLFSKNIFAFADMILKVYNRINIFNKCGNCCFIN